MNYQVFVPFKYLAIILILLTGNVYGQQKSNSYYDFPPLYNFDNYDACLKSNHENSQPTYCMVYAEVKPNKSSELLQQMIEHSEEFPFRYRRDKLFFGVCVERCKNVSNATLIHFSDEEDGLHNEISNYFGKVHQRHLDLQFRKEYHTQIHNCLNFKFQKKYNLNLRTYIEYCVRAEDEIQNIEKTDYLENIFYTILGILFILIILSTWYDYRLKLQQPEDNQIDDFYKINPTTTDSKLLTSFSICRNYYRLIQPYYSDVGKDLKFLDCYRVIAMIMAVYGHSSNYLEYQHISNPEYFEYSEKDKNKLWLLCTTPIIRIFFVMSGLFLFVKFQQMKLIGPHTSWRKFFITFLQLLVFRYIRFLPSIALLTLFNATVFIRLQDGPFWRHIAEPTHIFTRNNGWRNLLMVNNFSQKDTASHHTWYLAADFQLFFLYLLVLMVIAKYPKIKKYIYTSMFILSIFIPFLISYWFHLPPSFMIKPESYRYTFIKDIDVYYKVYTPFYTNLSGYLVGIICGEIYLKYTSTEKIRKIVRETKVYLYVYLFTPVAFMIFWSSAMLELRKPSFWTALYTGIHLIVWDIIICSTPLLAMSCKVGWITYEFCCLPMFRILARLSFQVYLWHLTIIHLINSYQRQPYYVNNLYNFTQFIITLTVSNIAAFFIALCVEYPLAQCTQLLSFKGTAKNIKKTS